MFFRDTDTASAQTRADQADGFYNAVMETIRSFDPVAVSDLLLDEGDPLVVEALA